MHSPRLTAVGRDACGSFVWEGIAISVVAAVTAESYLLGGPRARAAAARGTAGDVPRSAMHVVLAVRRNQSSD